MRTVVLAAALLAPALGVMASLVEKEIPIYSGPADVARWKTNGGQPVPPANAQADGLNPHGSGGYIVMYEEPVRDFILDFDYKLSKGCNSGVFFRVGKADDPVMTGIEVALDDTTGTGMHDSGAFYDLVKTTRNTQKGAGEWNHMTIEARGAKVSVRLNGETVATLDHDAFAETGKRPDGSSHKFNGVAIKNLNQKGYLGFQDHGQDCWYKNVKLTVLD
jgi:hypothetical protein